MDANGVSVPNTPLVIDRWSLKDVHPRSLFFLSHMHADHTKDLNSQWLQPIHCTPVSAKLAENKFNINPSVFVKLEFNQPRILSVDLPKEGGRVSITVTAFDANHCPGSAMFLFEGYFGTILYTGDFRFHSDMLKFPCFNGSCSIDDLYLDNTYCDPECNFPSQEDSTEEILRIIGSNTDKVVLIGLHTLGKEDLLYKIAQHSGQYIGVFEDRFQTLELLQLPPVFTQDSDECRIRVYHNYHIIKGTAREMKNGTDYIAILPTCLYTGRGAPTPPEGNPRLKVVNYSDHSSFSELWDFVKCICPKKIHPIVKSFSGPEGKTAAAIRCNMAVFDKLLDPSPRREISVPPTINQLLRLPVLPAKMSQLRFASPTASLRPNKPTRKGVHYISPAKKNPKEMSDQPQANKTKRSDNPSNVYSDPTTDTCARLIPYPFIKNLAKPSTPAGRSDNNQALGKGSSVTQDTRGIDQRADSRDVTKTPLTEPAVNLNQLPLNPTTDTSRPHSQESSIPFEAIRKMAAVAGPEGVLYSCNDGMTVKHDWGAEHVLDRATAICRCSLGRMCLLSLLSYDVEAS